MVISQESLTEEVSSMYQVISTENTEQPLQPKAIPVVFPEKGSPGRDLSIFHP